MDHADQKHTRRRGGVAAVAARPLTLIVCGLVLGGLMPLAACTYIAESLGKATQRPKVDVHWLKEMDALDAPAQRTVNLTVQNVSGEDAFNVDGALRASLSQRYTLVDDPSQAQYTMKIRISSFSDTSGLVDQVDADEWARIVGSTARSSKGTLSHTTADGLPAGEQAAGKATKDIASVREWTLVSNLVVEERLPKAKAPRPKRKGDPKDFVHHEAQLAVAASEIGMTSENAKPLIQPRLVAALNGCLP